MGGKDARMIDITPPAAREQAPGFSRNDTLLLAVPVYMGRVPEIIHDWLARMRADKTPTVCLVVYGNRAYEDALLELSDIAAGCGCDVIAGGAYIGEHSFSAAEAPVAEGRPDENDLRHAAAFGKAIRNKLENEDGEDDAAPALPGVAPYRGSTKLWDVDFIEITDACTNCLVCVDVCPAGAIDRSDVRATDIVKCVTCCACIKKCPASARRMKPGLVKNAQQRLNTIGAVGYKNPEVFS